MAVGKIRGTSLVNALAFNCIYNVESTPTTASTPPPLLAGGHAHSVILEKFLGYFGVIFMLFWS